MPKRIDHEERKEKILQTALKILLEKDIKIQT